MFDELPILTVTCSQPLFRSYSTPEGAFAKKSFIHLPATLFISWKVYSASLRLLSSRGAKSLLPQELPSPKSPTGVVQFDALRYLPEVSNPNFTNRFGARDDDDLSDLGEVHFSDD
ncbi:2403_t:CDS:2, partial [Paraglomus occultum]